MHGELVPLTPEQRAILFESLNEGAGIYAVQIRCRLTPFRLEVFQEAWKQVVERHDVLRLRVRWQGRAVPAQGTQADPPTGLKVANVRGASPAGLHETATKLFDEEFAREFDIETDRLVLPYVVYSDDVAFVAWTTHHLVMDGLSSRLLLQEVLDEYDRMLAGMPSPPVRSGSFLDYVRWRNARPVAAAPAGAEESVPDGVQPSLLRALGASSAPGSARRVLEFFPENLSARMRVLARREGITAATQFHAAWALALASLTGQERFSFGTTSYGRPPEVTNSEATLGMFTITRRLSSPLPVDDTLASWLSSFQRDLVAVWDGDKSSGSLASDPIVVVSHYPPTEEFEGPNSGTELEILDVVDRTPHPVVATVFVGDPALVVLNINGITTAAGAPERLLEETFSRLEYICSRNPQKTPVRDLLDVPAHPEPLS